MTSPTPLRPNPPALPMTRADLVRKTMSKQTLNDHVETCFLTLWEDKQFQAFIDAVDDSQAVEGSISADSLKAAEMIREQGVKDNNATVAREKLAPLIKALNRVLIRYGQSRNERRVGFSSPDTSLAA